LEVFENTEEKTEEFTEQGRDEWRGGRRSCGLGQDAGRFSQVY
jgi:hypothetical protein